MAEVQDFMPIDHPHEVTDRHRLVRVIQGIRGKVQFEARIEPRFDYGRQPHRTRVERRTGPLRHRRPGAAGHLAPPVDRDEGAARSPVHRQGRRLRRVPGRIRGRPGHHASATARSSTCSRRPRRSGASGSAGSRYRGPLARDGRALGHHAQAHDLCARAARWWRRRPPGCPSRSAASATGTTATPGSATPRSRSTPCWASATPRRPPPSDAGCAIGSRAARPGSATPLAIMYRVDGSSDLVEETLDHWEGYRGSFPVRIGNGAAEQLQLDIYGEAMDAIHHGARNGLGVADAGWTAAVRPARLGGRQLGPARRRGVGDPGRPPALRLRPAHVLGGARSRRPTGRRARAARRRRAVAGGP